MSTTNFDAFGLSSPLLASLGHMRVSIPTPIQAQAIPPALEGVDILGSAQTGTGKTLAYLIPILAQLSNTSWDSALILTPTRELAAQVKETVFQLTGKKSPLQAALLIGGDPIFKQIAILKRHPRVIIGTPGRVVDHLNRGTLSLKNTRFFVLDETDRMLDMGFSESLEIIVPYLSTDRRQTFMFSATMPPSIIKLSKKYLTNPKHIAVGSVTQPVANIKQSMLQTSDADKFSHLLTELDQREGSIIVFVKTKIGAERLADKLKDKNHDANAIHGDLKQRQRDQVIRAFREHKNRILVATDIAARGLDIPHIKHVINYDLPQCAEDYIHRIGRTGRAGNEGHALSLVSSQDRSKWRVIHRLISSTSNNAYNDFPEEPRNSRQQRPARKWEPSEGRRFQSRSSSDNAHSSERRTRSSHERSESSRPWERKKSTSSDERAPSRPWERKKSASSDDRAPSRPWERKKSASSDERAPSRPWEKKKSASSDERAPSRPWERKKSSSDERTPSRPWEKKKSASSDDRAPSRPWERKKSASSDERKPISSDRRDSPSRERASSSRPWEKKKSSYNASSQESRPNKKRVYIPKKREEEPKE